MHLFPCIETCRFDAITWPTRTSEMTSSNKATNELFHVDRISRFYVILPWTKTSRMNCFQNDSVEFSFTVRTWDLQVLTAWGSTWYMDNWHQNSIQILLHRYRWTYGGSGVNRNQIKNDRVLFWRLVPNKEKVRLLFKCWRALSFTRWIVANPVGQLIAVNINRAIK